MIKKNDLPDKRITITVDYESWEKFRQIAFDDKISMTKLLQEFISKFINKYSKKGIDK